MKNGRSFGLGGITLKLVKYREEYLNKYQLQLIINCLKQNKMLKQ